MKQRSIKRIITFMFSLVLMSLCCICANAENDIDIDGAYEFAKDFLSEYYYAKDQNADYDFTTFVESDALLEFANQKAESARYRYIVYETDDKQDYQLEFSLSDTYECDGNVVLDIGVKASFKYKYYDRSSSIGDKTLVMIRCEDGRYTVKDWYTFLDSFDSSIRGEIASLNDPNYWDVSVCAEELTSMLENEVQKSYQYFMLMKEQMADNETEAISVSEEREVLSTTATSYSINKTALVNWATLWDGKGILRTLMMLCIQLRNLHIL